MLGKVSLSKETLCFLILVQEQCFSSGYKAAQSQFLFLSNYCPLESKNRESLHLSLALTLDFNLYLL